MIEIMEHGLLYLQFEELNSLGFIKHLFTSRVGWDKHKIKDQLSLVLGVDSKRIISVKQVHGTNILIVKSIQELPSEKGTIEGDGIITDIPGVLLITYHADCVPIYFVDRKKKVVGMAHAGWRGTFDNISGEMVNAFRNNYNSETEDIVAAIGPSIGPCCYEVGNDVKKLFNDRYGNFSEIIINKGEKAYLDLKKVNYFQLIEKGLPEENIILSNICTSCNVDKLYSYRKEKGTDKRMVAGICLL
ncbi:MAG TPA: peptidoglycan editing factor PgeF [Tissierellia bacterium]|nr:peptidoglycan editing factor PgeF [Tissierellia bacterium]